MESKRDVMIGEMVRKSEKNTNPTQLNYKYLYICTHYSLKRIFYDTLRGKRQRIISTISDSAVEVKMKMKAL